METKTFINLNKITQISVTFEKLTEYEWYDECQGYNKKFLGIVYDKVSSIPGGWSKYRHIAELKQSTEDILSIGQYHVDESNKQVVRKAYVEIFTGENTFTRWFESNHDADEYAEYLRVMCGNKFEIIIN
jgi:hypothetical protein